MKMSEDDFVGRPRNKTMVFTLEERKCLLKLVNMHLDILNNKRVDSASTHLKNQAWETIHKHYLENTGLIPRTPQQLKRCWENMKCKARKGDPMSVKLLRWSEAQYRLLQNGDQRRDFKTQIEFPLSINLDSDSEQNNERCKSNTTMKAEIQNSSNQTKDNSLLKITEVNKISDCIHCACDKVEKNAKAQLLTLQRQQNEELHQLKLQLTKEKLKHEKELHKLYMHEMTLKIENERRRAEILDRELGNYGNTCAT